MWLIPFIIFTLILLTNLTRTVITEMISISVTSRLIRYLCVSLTGAGGRHTRMLVLYTCMTTGFQNIPLQIFPFEVKHPYKRILEFSPPLSKNFWRRHCVELMSLKTYSKMSRIQKNTLYLESRHIIWYWPLKEYSVILTTPFHGMNQKI